MKIVIINKSDARGGAAVAEYRIMNALASCGADVRMITAEKLTDDPRVELAASPSLIKEKFLADRLPVFLRNGLSRKTLFKIDTASAGLPLWKHPLVAEADAIMLGWVNQGLLSLSGIEKLAALGKPLIWTMHDMWSMTGVCHHAYSCREYMVDCRCCPLLSAPLACHSLARTTLRSKQKIYDRSGIRFTAVSNWLARKGHRSTLLREADITVIPNPIEINPTFTGTRKEVGKIRIAFGAARLDDEVKGFPILIEATRLLKERHPELSGKTELHLFGGIRDKEALNEIKIPCVYHGTLKADEVGRLLSESHIVVSTSLYETMGYTLLEGQAYGAVPVAFDRGGQSDVIAHRQTGYLAEYSDNITTAAADIVDGIVWAAENQSEAVREKMLKNVTDRFSPQAVGKAFIRLLAP